MKMIEARKVIPLIRLILFGNPNVDEICKTAQELVDLHTVEAEPVVLCKDCNYYGDGEYCPALTLADYTNPNDFCCWAERRYSDANN